MDNSEFMEYVETMKKESTKYRELKQKIEVIEGRIDDLIESAIAIKKEFGVSVVKIPKSKTYKPRDPEQNEIINSFLQKAREGVLITMELLRATYPEMSENQIKYIYTKISKCSGIDKGRDGHKYWLFARRSN